MVTSPHNLQKQQSRNQHWSGVSQRYDQNFQSPEASLYDEIEGQLLVELTGACPGRRILDLCSGTGRNTLKLAQTGADMWGIDAAIGMVLRAREKAEAAHLTNAQFTRASAFAIPFADETFDAVTGTRFMYMMSPSEKHRIMAEIRRVLKPRGVIVLQFNGGFWGIKKELENFCHGVSPRLRYRYLWPGQVRRLFKGCHVQSVVGVKLPWLASLVSLVGESAARSVNKILRYPGFNYLSAYVLVKAKKA